MSGITPILDTLLHQVLGWQRDASAARLLPAKLVPPPHPAQPAATVHSDSRLDPRAAVATPRGAASTAARGALAARYAGAESRSDGAATVTRFTTAARAIADILARYPDAPAVIRARSPLVDALARAHAHELATALRASIEASGLFYESHLRRWLGGTFASARLAREPQMGQAQRDPAAQGSPDAPRYTEGPVRADLAGVVRQQLEMLAVPGLRWEGEAWPGLFMTLAVHPPPEREDGDDSDGRHERRRDGAGTWRSELNLRLPRLGDVSVDLRMGSTWVALDLRAPPATALRMQSDSAALRRRLGSAGFRRVAVRVRETAGREVAV